jgi:Chaperone of endosialidase
VTIDEAIKKISKIRGVTYKRVWRDKDDQIVRISPNKDYGFVAQEVEVVFPEAVILEEGKNFRTVKYAEIVSASIQAINEQKLILDESEKRLEFLENRAKEKGLI